MKGKKLQKVIEGVGSSIERLESNVRAPSKTFLEVDVKVAAALSKLYANDS